MEEGVGEGLAEKVGKGLAKGWHRVGERSAKVGKGLADLLEPSNFGIPEAPVSYRQEGGAKQHPRTMSAMVMDQHRRPSLTLSLRMPTPNPAPEMKIQPPWDQIRVCRKFSLCSCRRLSVDFFDFAQEFGGNFAVSIRTHYTKARLRNLRIISEHFS